MAILERPCITCFKPAVTERNGYPVCQAHADSYDSDRYDDWKAEQVESREPVAAPAAVPPDELPFE